MHSSCHGAPPEHRNDSEQMCLLTVFKSSSGIDFLGHFHQKKKIIFFFLSPVYSPGIVLLGKESIVKV